jgi:hypothetical protein
VATRAPQRNRPDISSFDFAAAAADELALAEEQEVASRREMMDYARLMPEPSVGELRFDDFPFQVEWYSEEVANCEEVVWAKGAQVGASGYGVRWVIRQVDQFSDTGLYVMPTLDDVFEFGDERVEPAIEESPYLLSRIRGKYVRNKRLKRIGRGFLHMRGSNSKSGAQSVAATFLFLDEADLLDQTNLPHILRRVTGARQRGKVPKIRWAGYPLLPNTGIDAKWQSSDQRVWHVRCLECDDEQPITWEENVRWTVPDRLDSSGELRVMRAGADEYDDRTEIEHVWRQCRSCAASLEDTSPHRKDGAIRVGRWIPKRPGAPIIGFHVWRGMVPVTDLKQLVIASRGTKEEEREAFAALDLGRPHIGGDATLTDNDLERAMSFGVEQIEAYYGPNPTTMGVDVAGERDLNVQIDEQLPPERPGVPNPRRTLWCGTCETFEQVCDLIERFRVHVVAIDSNPERRMAKALRLTYPGRVVLVEYRPNVYGGPEPLVLVNDDAGLPLKAQVNRTDAIDGMMDAIRQVRQIPLRTPPPKWKAQMKALVRRTELDTKGRPVRRYITTGTDGDDYAHAATYALVATELWRTWIRVQAIREEAEGRHVPDEEQGFRRVRLAAYDG